MTIWLAMFHPKGYLYQRQSSIFRMNLEKKQELEKIHHHTFQKCNTMLSTFSGYFIHNLTMITKFRLFWSITTLLINDGNKSAFDDVLDLLILYVI